MKKPFKNDAKMDILTYVKMSSLVRLLLYTSASDNAYRSNPLRLKRLEGVNWQFDFIPFGFSKNNLSRETAEPCHLWLFQKIWRSSSILAISVIFFFWGGEGVTDISSLQKKLTLAYNSWYKQRLSFNLLEVGCLIIIFISVLD